MPTAEQAETPVTTSSADSGLLVSTASLDHDSFELLLANLAAAFPGQTLTLASPDTPPGTDATGPIRIVGYHPAAPTTGGWTLTAADFLNAHELARQHNSHAILLLGDGAQTLAPRALQALAAAVLGASAGLAAPNYDLPPNAGLVNSAILYPLSRALFGVRARFPLALDLCLSPAAAERLAAAAQRLTAAAQPEAILWPLTECAVAGLAITEVEAGPRALPAPPTHDLNTLLAQVAGSLFSEIETRAAFWQRARMPGPPLPRRAPAAPTHAAAQELRPMLDSFRLAYTNLHEIWSLVLPPQSLLGLKRLSTTPPESFLMPDSLWARIVYDFVLAYRLRTLNRGHLLGALTPLYLAWVASHLLQMSAGTDPETHIEAVAAAFEADKPYLVSRWRWPDRFNP